MNRKTSYAVLAALALATATTIVTSCGTATTPAADKVTIKGASK